MSGREAAEEEPKVDLTKLNLNEVPEIDNRKFSKKLTYEDLNEIDETLEELAQENEEIDDQVPERKPDSCCVKVEGMFGSIKIKCNQCFGCCLDIVSPDKEKLGYSASESNNENSVIYQPNEEKKSKFWFIVAIFQFLIILGLVIALILTNID